MEHSMQNALNSGEATASPTPCEEEWDRAAAVSFGTPVDSESDSDSELDAFLEEKAGIKTSAFNSKRILFVRCLLVFCIAFVVVFGVFRHLQEGKLVGLERNSTVKSASTDSSIGPMSLLSAGTTPAVVISTETVSSSSPDETIHVDNCHVDKKLQELQSLGAEALEERWTETKERLIAKNLKLASFANEVQNKFSGFEHGFLNKEEPLQKRIAALKAQKELVLVMPSSLENADSSSSSLLSVESLGHLKGQYFADAVRDMEGSCDKVTIDTIEGKISSIEPNSITKGELAELLSSSAESQCAAELVERLLLQIEIPVSESNFEVLDLYAIFGVHAPRVWDLDSGAGTNLEMNRLRVGDVPTAILEMEAFEDSEVNPEKSKLVSQYRRYAKTHVLPVVGQIFEKVYEKAAAIARENTGVASEAALHEEITALLPKAREQHQAAQQKTDANGDLEISNFLLPQSVKLTQQQHSDLSAVTEFSQLSQKLADYKAEELQWIGILFDQLQIRSWLEALSAKSRSDDEKFMQSAVSFFLNMDSFLQVAQYLDSKQLLLGAAEMKEFRGKLRAVQNSFDSDSTMLTSLSKEIDAAVTRALKDQRVVKKIQRRVFALLSVLVRGTGSLAWYPANAVLQLSRFGLTNFPGKKMLKNRVLKPVQNLVGRLAKPALVVASLAITVVLVTQTGQEMEKTVSAAMRSSLGVTTLLTTVWSLWQQYQFGYRVRKSLYEQAVPTLQFHWDTVKMLATECMGVQGFETLETQQQPDSASNSSSLSTLFQNLQGKNYNEQRCSKAWESLIPRLPSLAQSDHYLLNRVQGGEVPHMQRAFQKFF